MNGEKSRRAPGIRYFEKFEKQSEKLLCREWRKERNAIKENVCLGAVENLDRRFLQVTDLVSREDLLMFSLKKKKYIYIEHCFVDIEESII